MSIADNLKKIEEKITKAAEISGRKREECTSSCSFKNS